MAPSRVRYARWFLTAVLFAAGVPGGGYAAYCGIIIATGNLHAVEPGRLYRSAQLDKAGLGAVIALYHLHSVLNLRGPNPNSAWYVDERAAARQAGVAHYDVALSARRAPAPEQIARILDILRTAPKPLLIHCRSGADRTGLVAALYRYAIEHQPAAQAAGELSLRYGHFPYLTSGTGAMDAGFAAFVQAAAGPAS